MFDKCKNSSECAAEIERLNKVIDEPTFPARAKFDIKKYIQGLQDRKAEYERRERLHAKK